METQQTTTEPTTEQRIQALAKHLGCDVADISESIYGEGTFDAEGGEYLVLTDEEADELADIIGIINKGKIVAEDSPANLKMQIGSDVIIIELKSVLKDLKKLEKISGVTSVKSRGDTLSIYAKNGGAVISSVVSTLHDLNTTIVNVEIRKPTLDDVFLKVTGEA